MSSETQPETKEYNEENDSESEDIVYEIGDDPDEYHPIRCCHVRVAEREDESSVNPVTTPSQDKKCKICSLFD